MAEEMLADRYRILSPLGAGGMGEVFLAEDTRLERQVAVKLLPASAQGDAVVHDAPFDVVGLTIAHHLQNRVRCANFYRRDPVSSGACAC